MAPNLVIIQLLHSPANPAEFLRLCWDNISRKQKKEIFYFLYNAKQYKTFLTVLRLEMNSEDPMIPWTQLFTILIRVNLLNEDELAAFLSSGVSTQEFAKFRVNHSRLSQLWDETKQTVLLNFDQKRDELLKSLEFAKQQGLKEPRLKILNELIRNYPNDEQVLKILSQEKEFQARQVIARATSKKEMANDIRLTASPQHIDDELRARLLKQALEKVKKNPQMAVDLTVMFYHMDFYDEAFQIIEADRTGDVRLIWYEIIISIEAEKFVRAMSAINRLKGVRLEEADSSFSMMYYHALVLHGMGHKAEALQVLRNIVKIRPQFKSAVTLLSDWENEK
ncbi:MAG: hypothetical protein K2Q26_00335 [Bdellovibrionales bacterium]|nr:hypothetical protein [Bdellovibrionales bacterium]